MERGGRLGITRYLHFGWVKHAGFEPAAFIETFAPHLACMLVRDYASLDGFVEVGRGSIDWPSIVDALDRAGFSRWLVAESEFNELWRGETDPRQSALSFVANQEMLVEPRTSASQLPVE